MFKLQNRDFFVMFIRDPASNWGLEAKAGRNRPPFIEGAQLKKRMYFIFS